ncbi:phage tail tape measure protein [Pelagibacterium sp.]|uniref:phage tail tape measure protein n=1 Tax=Pelagibacterium sp. TaxID=1967288 RepID=UPI003A9213DE
MQRRPEEFKVRFGATGTRDLKADLEGISKSIGKLRDVSFNAISSVGKIGAGIGAAATAWVGGISAIAVSNDQYVDQVNRISNATGMQLETMSRIAGVARQYGIDIDDLRGAFIQFYGQVNEGAKGSSVAEDFEAMGISAQYLADNLNNPLDVLMRVAEAQRSLSGAQRTSILAAMFGEDDSAKLVTFLDDLGTGSEALQDSIENIDLSGAVITEEDVRIGREFNAAVAEIGDVFRGMRLELARTVLPTIGDLSEAFAGWMRENREMLSGGLETSWRRVGYVIDDVVKYLQSGRDAVQGSWLEPIVRWAENLGNAAATTSRALGELFDELFGQRQTDEFVWVEDVARGIRGLGTLLVAALDGIGNITGAFITEIVGYLNRLPDAVDAVESAWAELQEGFQTGDGNTVLGQTGALLRDLWDYAVGLKDALAAIAAGESVDGQFAWVKDLADNMPGLIEAIRSAGNLDDILLGIVSGFGSMLDLGAPFVAVVAGLTVAFGGVGLAIGVAALALGTFLAKLAEGNELVNAPFKWLDGMIREINGAADAERELLDQMRQDGDDWYDQRRRQGYVDDSARSSAGGATQQIQTENVQAIGAVTVDMDMDQLRGLVDQAVSMVSGAQQTAAFAPQIMQLSETRAPGSRSVESTQQQPQGTPVVIELWPTGEQVTVYAQDDDVAEQLLDLVSRAKRSSATQGGLPFAGDD